VVSGANGFIASHIVDLLLELGFRVRGTVREAKPWLDKYFEEKYGQGRFSSINVPAIEAKGAFDEAVKGAAGFVHVVCVLIRFLNLVYTQQLRLRQDIDCHSINIGCRYDLRPES